MGLKCGIVGLPNVGKSTFFNALTASESAEAANYPFCTIEPNAGIVHVPDARLEKIAQIAGSKEIIPAYIEFVDIAGLIKGASKGDGLGNKFLSHIRMVDAIIHVVRCFEDPDVIHVYGKIDPMHDTEIIETELILADMESLETRISNAEKKLKSGDQVTKDSVELMKKVHKHLSLGLPARSLAQNKQDMLDLASLQILTSKPVLYVCNVLENDAVSGNSFSDLVQEKATKEGAGCVVISSKIESELSLLSENEAKEFLGSMGLKEAGLKRVIRAAYELLGMYSYFTVGPKEARAWTFPQNMLAPAAAGIIHTDFEKGFIRAEVIAYQDYVSAGGEAGAKNLGKMRLEGKEYEMHDGDVVHFRFNT